MLFLPDNLGKCMPVEADADNLGKCTSISVEVDPDNLATMTCKPVEVDAHVCQYHLFVYSHCCPWVPCEPEMFSFTIEK